MCDGAAARAFRVASTFSASDQSAFVQMSSSSVRKSRWAFRRPSVTFRAPLATSQPGRRPGA
jgi:hypothetical protein